jgi:hypothetical protein
LQEDLTQSSQRRKDPVSQLISVFTQRLISYIINRMVIK